MSALLAALGGDLVTTPVGATGILASCTVAAIADAAAGSGSRVAERLLRPAELAGADAAWLVSAVRGVCPIETLDGAPMSRDARLHARLLRWAGFADRL